MQHCIIPGVSRVLTHSSSTMANASFLFDFKRSSVILRLVFFLNNFFPFLIRGRSSVFKIRKRKFNHYAPIVIRRKL